MQLITYSIDTPLMRATMTTLLDDAQVAPFIRAATRAFEGFAIHSQITQTVDDAESAMESTAREYNARRRIAEGNA